MRAPAPPFFMVARFTDPATPRVTGGPGFYVFCGVLLASRAMSDAAAAKTASASVALTLFPKERPLAAEAKDWCDDAKPLLPADQRALIDGLTPRALLSYTASTVPAEITAGEPGAAHVTADTLSPPCVMRAREHAGASSSGVARGTATQDTSASIASRAIACELR